MTLLQQLERRCTTFPVVLERAACREFEAQLRGFVELAPSAGLVPIVGGGIDTRGRPYVEHAAGPGAPRLGERVASTGPLDLDEAVAVTCAILRGLSELHGQGLVHGAVRPDAVVTTAEGPALVDPVPAVVAVRLGPPAPAFAPPELLRGEPPTSASDVFAAAATLLYLAAGRTPWSDPNADAETVLFRMLSGAPPELGPLAADRVLGTAVRRALDLDPQARPAAAELAAVLARSRRADAGDRLDDVDTVPPGGFGVLAHLVDPADGTPLGSRYLLHERLGQGATGRVFRGSRRGGRGEVAVKLLHDHLTDDPAMVSRFLAERSALVGIDHPNVVRVHDLVAEGSTLAIVMDLVDGPTLRRWMRTAPPLPPASTCRLLAQLAAALAAVHGAGIVHRDLKPENVLLERVGTADLRIRLTDFGIARSTAPSPRLTQAGHILGTPKYVAPEVAVGGTAGPAADVYALGVLAYELLVGWHPFGALDATDSSALLQAHVELTPPRPPGLHAGLWDLVAACMAKEPAVRPTATQLARALTEQSEGIGDDAPPFPRLDVPPVVEPAARRAVPARAEDDASTTQLGVALPSRPPAEPADAAARARRRVWRRALAAAGVALVAGGAVGVWTAFADPDEDRPRPPVARSVYLPTEGERVGPEVVHVRFEPHADADRYVVVRDPQSAAVPLDAQPLEGASFVEIADEENDVRHCYVVIALVFEASPSTTPSSRPPVLDPYCVL